MKHILPFLLLTVLGGCASEPKKIEPKKEPTTTVWRLTFDKRLEQNDFASPILNVDFGAETLPFYISTAATAHTIDVWAATASKVTVANGQLKSDVEIDDDFISNMTFTVAKQNSRYEDSGMAGWLAPQLFIGDKNAVAMDFLNSKFHRGNFDDLLKERGAVLVTPDTGKICASSEKIPFYVLVVKIDDISMNLLIDSAAEDTTVMENHPAAKKLSKDGKSNFSKLHKGKVSVGGKTVTRLVDIKPLPNLPCGAEGVLGMDVLKLCSIVIDRQRFGVNCITD